MVLADWFNRARLQWQTLLSDPDPVNPPMRLEDPAAGSTTVDVVADDLLTAVASQDAVAGFASVAAESATVTEVQFAATLFAGSGDDSIAAADSSSGRVDYAAGVHELAGVTDDVAGASSLEAQRSDTLDLSDERSAIAEYSSEAAEELDVDASEYAIAQIEAATDESMDAVDGSWGAIEGQSVEHEADLGETLSIFDASSAHVIAADVPPAPRAGVGYPVWSSWDAPPASAGDQLEAAVIMDRQTASLTAAGKRGEVLVAVDAQACELVPAVATPWTPDPAEDLDDELLDLLAFDMLMGGRR